MPAFTEYHAIHNHNGHINRIIIQEDTKKITFIHRHTEHCNNFMQQFAVNLATANMIDGIEISRHSDDSTKSTLTGCKTINDVLNYLVTCSNSINNLIGHAAQQEIQQYTANSMRAALQTINDNRTYAERTNRRSTSTEEYIGR